MSRASLTQSHRSAGFAAALKGARALFHGRLARAAAALVLAAALGHTALRDVHAAAADPATHQEILNGVNDIKSKVDVIPPAWSQTLPAAERFQLVLGGAGVLDKETGLVWEK